MIKKITKIGDISREIERQKALEKQLSFKFIRINPDKENFNIF